MTGNNCFTPVWDSGLALSQSDKIIAPAITDDVRVYFWMSLYIHFADNQDCAGCTQDKTANGPSFQHHEP